MVLARAAEEKRELRHLDVNQAVAQTDIDKDMYIEIPVEFQDFSGAVGRLNKATYGLF